MRRPPFHRCFATQVRPGCDGKGQRKQQASKGMKLMMDRRRISCESGLALPANCFFMHLSKMLYAWACPHVRFQCNAGAQVWVQRRCLPVMGEDWVLKEGDFDRFCTKSAQNFDIHRYFLISSSRINHFNHLVSTWRRINQWPQCAFSAPARRTTKDRLRHDRSPAGRHFDPFTARAGSSIPRCFESSAISCHIPNICDGIEA